MSDRLSAAVSELVEALREELRTEADAGPRTPDRLYSIEDAAGLLAIGRTLAYQEIAAGRLSSIKIGRRRVVSSGAIAAYARIEAA